MVGGVQIQKIIDFFPVLEMVHLLFDISSFLSYRRRRTREAQENEEDKEKEDQQNFYMFSKMTFYLIFGIIRVRKYKRIASLFLYLVNHFIST